MKTLSLITTLTVSATLLFSAAACKSKAPKPAVTAPARAPSNAPGSTPAQVKHTKSHQKSAKKKNAAAAPGKKTNK